MNDFQFLFTHFVNGVYNRHSLQEPYHSCWYGCVHAQPHPTSPRRSVPVYDWAYTRHVFLIYSTSRDRVCSRTSPSTGSSSHCKAVYNKSYRSNRIKWIFSILFIYTISLCSESLRKWTTKFWYLYRITPRYFRLWIKVHNIINPVHVSPFDICIHDLTRYDLQ